MEINCYVIGRGRLCVCFFFKINFSFVLYMCEVVKFVVDEYFFIGNIIFEGKVKRCIRKIISCRN